MKRYGCLFEDMSSFENLLLAFKQAIQGVGKKYYSLKYWANLESNLFKLQKELKTENYQPNDYRYFKIYKPKERTIAVADFEDRVVHNAIVNILEPIYEKSFIYNSYATRKNKGTHKAIQKAQSYLKNNFWYFKTDIKKYFDSIDHNILNSILKRKIKDKKLLILIEKIITNGGDNGKGLPIGNLTSQFFANVYLDKLDHYLKDNLGIKYYIRYMDDFVVLSENKEYLKKLRKKIKEFLANNLKLQLKAKATFINSRTNGLPFLGTRIFTGTIRVKKENLERSINKIKLRERQYQTDKISEEKLQQSVNSIIAHLQNYNSYNLRKDIFSDSSW